MARPDWIKTLATECKRTSQTATAVRLGVSATMVNQVLKDLYPGNQRRIEERVRGELMNKTVDCLVFGTISARRCMDLQDMPFAATSPQRVAIYKACRCGKCKHSK